MTLEVPELRDATRAAIATPREVLTNRRADRFSSSPTILWLSNALKEVVHSEGRRLGKLKSDRGRWVRSFRWFGAVVRSIRPFPSRTFDYYSDEFLPSIVFGQVRLVA